METAANEETKTGPIGDGEGASKRAEHGIHTTQGGVETNQ
jgi:hypothetical protein